MNSPHKKPKRALLWLLTLTYVASVLLPVNAFSDAPYLPGFAVLGLGALSLIQLAELGGSTLNQWGTALLYAGVLVANLSFLVAWWFLRGKRREWSPFFRLLVIAGVVLPWAPWFVTKLLGNPFFSGPAYFVWLATVVTACAYALISGL